MKIFIQYQNNKSIFETEKYQSIYSIISKYLNENNNIHNKEPSNYFLDYNGQYLNKDTCLEKYDNIYKNISSDEIIHLNLFDKKKGGADFFSFIVKNPFTVFIVFVIAILPIFILPTGFLPLISGLIKNIVEKSIDSICKYLACVLGKKTLYKRIKLLLVFLQYIVFFLMIYIVISFPIILLCITLKGYNITDNPLNMCSPLKMGNMIGLIVTILYIGIYLLYRGGNYIFEGLAYLCSFSYYLNMIFNPFFKSILRVFNRIKYIPIYIIPFVGQGILAYHTSMELSLIAIEIILGSFASLTCTQTNTKMKDGQKFISSVLKKVKDVKDKYSSIPECECVRKQREKEAYEEVEQQNIENEKKIPEFKSTEYLCFEDKIKCCAAERYVNIADTLSTLLNNPMLSGGIKTIGLFPAFILFTNALYESALIRIGDTDDVLTKTIEQKKFYLRKIMKDKIDILQDDTKTMIKEYLNDQEIGKNSNDMIYEIKKLLQRNAPPDDEGIKVLRDRINGMEELMISYAKESGTTYTPGKSLFKNIFKFLFMDLFCNVASTSKSGKEIIVAMGSVNNMVDMLKSSSASGIITAIIYFFTIIGIIICGLFNFF